MTVKNRINFIISLQKKKVREEENLFVIEGDKLVKEFLASGEALKTLVAKPEFIKSLPARLKEGIEEIIPSTYEELKKISSLKTPHNALAVVRMPENKTGLTPSRDELSVVLDCIQDPGNLGTIIRAAAWFGIRRIFCSPDSVDVYNPKVIQSTMGAILHVDVIYTGIYSLLERASEEKIRIFGTVMEGESIYLNELDNKGIIILGNESRGISAGLLPFLTDKINIPKFTRTSAGIDSLNVGMAAAVVFSEFRRRIKTKDKRIKTKGSGMGAEL
jgi:TrmH family RNA methyltransferase